MASIYILLSLIIIFLILKRKVDFVSLGCITYLLYTYNCAIGTTWITGGKTGYYYYSNISLNTYWCVMSQQLMIVFFLLYEKIQDKKTTHLDYTNENMLINDSAFWKWLLFLCYVSFAYTIIYVIGISRFFSYIHKSEIIQNNSFTWSFAVWGSILLCVHYTINFNRKYLALSLFLIFITLVLGSRAYFTTTLIAMFFVKSRYFITTLRSNLKYSVLGIVLVFLLIQYKTIYAAVRSLDFLSVEEILAAANYSDTFSDITEFRTVFSLYDYIVTYNYRLELSDSLLRLVSFIPFANDMFPATVSVRMATIMKDVVFNSSYGLGSTFWGETYSMGGHAFLFLLTFIWIVLLKKSYKVVLRGTSYMPFIVVCAAYCSFYIHRLDWVQVCGCLKSVFFIFILWKIFSKRVTIQ